MKHNIVFVILTVAILVSGFFAVDIVQIFSNNSNDRSFRSISKIEDNAVYLSSEREIINPMTVLNPSEKKVTTQQREIATAVVSAMSRYNNTTYIAMCTDITLFEAWQDGGNGLIYVDKWKYKNYGRKSERLLDCIIDTSDFSITYIRFYSEEVHDLPAYDLNKGLDKIRDFSNAFYPNLDVIETTMKDVLDTLKSKEAETDYDIYDYLNDYYQQEFYDLIGEEIIIYSPHYYIYRYIAMQKFINYIYDGNTLYNFWLSPVDMCNSYYSYSERSDEDDVRTAKIINVNPVNYILDKFTELPQWFTPSYSTKDGRIYQTISFSNEQKLVVIYSVKEDMVEGFYFEEN